HHFHTDHPVFSCSKIEQKQLNTWVSFQSAEQPLLGQFSVSGNKREIGFAQMNRRTVKGELWTGSGGSWEPPQPATLANRICTQGNHPVRHMLTCAQCSKSLPYRSRMRESQAAIRDPYQFPACEKN
ncbi:hypothetical protein, partial [Pseudomonas putida]|uniref:hypothetical protein n=1 Tax=Pseudomonas putida TaxID=303 RepID=UPI0035D4CF2B